MKLNFLLALAWSVTCYGENGAPPGLRVANTPFGPIELRFDGAVEPKSKRLPMRTAISARIYNGTSVEIEEMLFEFVFKDQFGNKLWLCQPPHVNEMEIRCDFHGPSNTPPGSEKPFGSGMVQRQPLPKGARVATMDFVVLHARYTPAYEIKVDASAIPNLKVDFTVYPKDGIALAFSNNSDSAIEILWDQCSFIDRDGVASRLMLGGTKFLDKDRPQPNGIIPPFSKYSASVFPINNLHYSSAAGYQKLPILPSGVSLVKPAPEVDLAIGSNLRLFMRYAVAGKTTDQLVTFTVSGVVGATGGL